MARAARGRDKWKLRPRVELYFALEDLDLTFTRGEVEATIALYNMGNSVQIIAEWLDRDIDAVAVLIMDLARKDKLNRLRVIISHSNTPSDIAWYLYNLGWSIEEIGREMYGEADN
jgi:hypothetical protein